ncbi:MAG: aminopeptidase P N-terminal domain-containing protein [Campylobacterota bacterium]
MNEQVYKERRERLLAMMDDGVAVLSTANMQRRSNDTEYPFRPNSDFYYLTGFEEDSSVVVLSKKGDEHITVLFVQEKVPEMELWTGERLGVEAAKECFSFDEVYDIKSFEEQIKELLKEQAMIYFELFNSSKVYRQLKAAAETMLHTRGVNLSPRTFSDITKLTQQMRLIKSSEEITLIKKALAITEQAHHKAMKVCQPEMLEYQLQAEYEYVFKKEGAYSDAYTTIIAGGNSANTLHYIKNDQPLNAGELVLVDAGCEYGFYASDITRTFPVNGAFTPAQKELYNMVLDVQLKVIAAIRPGGSKKELQAFSEKLLTEGMIAFGILEGDVDKLIDEKEHKKYYPHGIGHWMGLDVHDPSPYSDDNGEEILFAAGMVLTIEPGLYLPEDDMSIPEKYRGIGIRIEDNILITKEGCENLSSAIVKTVDEVESMCKS